MAQTNQSDVMDHNEAMPKSNNEGVVHLSKHQEEKQTAESSAFEQVMMQMNIADRKTFDRKYTELWNEASENNELLSLMICEIDFFKAYHDNYGHQGASFMLLVIALALKTTCEEHDCFLGRYKGDEFGILLKGGTPADAEAIAEKLRLAVEKSRTEHKFSSVSNIVTLSIGLSSFYPTSMQVVMNQASAALANAQSSGCNQVSGHLDSGVKEILVEQREQQALQPTVESEIQSPQQEAPVVSEPKQDTAKLSQEEEEQKAALAAKNEELLRQQEEEERLRKQEEEDKRKKEEPTYFDMDPFF